MNPARDNQTAPGSAGRLRAYLMFTVLLIAAWVLWSGMFKPLLLALGAVSCALVVYIAVRMGYFDSRVFALRFNLRLLGFWAWLLKEIVKSSLEVARIVLARKLELSTRVVEIDVSQLSPVDQVILGNSITLTPGTLTLDADDGKLLVHALTAEGAAALEEGEMLRRVAAIHKD
ncbi:MAG: Na+/H+ antiporter subunit E [Woeseiaceae bacterium]|nr:Na+/H+ antiporter subunit E [Woeseiaceae bacterium]